VSEDLTHYDVLGVEPSADKDAIRTAYQARLAEVQADVAREQGAKKPDQASIDGYRREEASVRNAWQVLSDPYQRGRYDATIEMGGGVAADEADDGDEVAVDEDRTPARATARDRRGQPYERPPGLFSTEPLPTPSTWPSGVRPPPPRARMLALAIDLFVLIVIFIAYLVGSRAIIDAEYPRVVDKLDRVTECTDRLDLAEDRDPLRLAPIERAETYCSDRAGVKLASESRRADFTKQEGLDDANDRVDERYRDLIGKTQSLQLIMLGVVLLLILLYLVPSTVRSGKTLGKKLMQIRVVNADGSPVRVRGALVRYGLPVLFVLTFQQILGPISFAIVLFVILSWPRNPNLQGMHDRIARTIVVDG
jgi:uncharacterized RDD family membrane protein YckC